ncbi:Gfo/Idh/MocA family protein [Jannaschia sp. CCS1]|uniref:Gfo/Idh/MocA family protein n=1 Tax=Jannaschia sp. (strain CCS1) TaxID=290400 RepID=UPI000053CAB8|nr:Gfo/Idh/MocA family oxidoreductase [Jannaschia sp. CCS1]ABD54384.1 oxidoreductase-like protein [Jannaschia sp. CCS1]
MTYKVVGISFDHMHMGDLLRMVDAHPNAEITALYDPDRAKMASAAKTFNIPDDALFTDFDACMAAGPYDLAILCCATADHAEMTERLAPHGVHIHVEKPFADSADNARRMIRAMKGTGKIMSINWPLAWVESHLTAKRLIDEGMIGELREVHFYDGNRGPLYHLADKVEVSPEEVEAQKPDSWWYKSASGGGSLLDYMGYGATLGTWYMGGEAPLEVTCTIDETPGIEVDQHAIAVVRYARGLSKMETRWGTFTDPWSVNPQPTCGFVFVGRDGTISSPDYAPAVTVQTRARPETHEIPVDPLPEGRADAIAYIIDLIERNAAPEGPFDPALCLTAQRIVDTAAASAAAKRTLEILP